MKFNQPVPELPVSDVEASQRYYRDVLGFKVEWLVLGEIGAVSHGETAIFFRQKSGTFESAVNWVFAEDVDAAFEELSNSQANIVEDIENKPWGLRQFAFEDPDGNRFYIHHDL